VTVVVRAAGDAPVHVPGTRLLMLAGNRERARAWREAWPAEDVVAAGELLDAVAHELRRPFLDVIASLGERHASLAWWCARVSERNTALSPLFENCVHVVAAGRAGANVCLVSDRPAVLRALGAEAPRRRRWVLQATRRVATFVAGAAARRHATRGLPLPASDARPVALVRTYVDDGCFAADGAFADRYFPGLAAWLDEEGYETWTAPVIMNVARSHRDLWARLCATGGRFLPEAQLLRGRDVAAAIRDGVRAARFPHGPVALEGIDVTELFDDERRRTACDMGTLEAALSARLAQRLAARGIDVALLVDTYENMIVDKALAWGFARYMPSTFVAGFQHGAMYPMLLCNFVPPRELAIAPLPDRVVCNGPGFREIVVREGLPPERVVAGPALRYRHLREVATVHGDRILVPLPMMDDVAAELLDKVLAGLAGLPIVLKPHPMARAEAQLAAAGASPLPAGFELVEGPMGPWLANARVVVASASSTLLEAVAAGVPVVVVGRDAAIDLNPLDWYPGLARVVHSPQELRAEVERLLEIGEDELAAWRERARAILEESFAPVTDEALRQFLP
jgi:hypothetical protein